MAEFWKSTHRTRTVAELESTIQKVLGRTGLMSFVQFDHGAIVRKETGRETPRMIRLVIGNPLIMKEMAKHVPDAGSYAPVTVLVDERPDGVHLSYDRMARLLAAFGNPDALQVANIWTAKSKLSCAKRQRKYLCRSDITKGNPRKSGGPDERRCSDDKSSRWNCGHYAGQRKAYLLRRGEGRRD